MASDGNYIIDTKINTSDLQSDLKDVAKQFDSMSDAAEGSKRDVEKAFDKIGDEAKSTGKQVENSFDDAFDSLFGANLFSNLAVNALEAIGDAAIDMAKESIQAASDIRAENAQFEQTFKGVEKTARDALEGIADETGITATRMQKSYSSIYAFTKSVGAETEDALDISSRALKAAADSAAYYDVSIEDATETLQSFLKGNYENDAALGIAATETTRNAKANELYAKSFAKLSESQKVDVLLSMVEAGNEASGALGQAAREADSWTNVTGELSEAWRQFLGLIGGPVIDTLTPVVQGLTTVLKGTVEAFQDADVDLVVQDWDLALQSTNFSLQALDETAASTSIAEEMTECQMAAEATAANVQQLKLEYDEAREAARQSLDAQIGLFDELVLQSDIGAKTIIENWQSQREAFAQYAENLQKAVNMGLDEALVQQLSDGSVESMSILNALVNDTGVNVDEINAEFQGVSKARDTVASTMAEMSTDMSSKLLEMAQNVSNEWGNMSWTVGAEIAEMQKYINSLTGSTVYVDVITRTLSGGSYSVTSYSSPVGYSAEPAAAYAIPANIPYLATGAVIPPNAPFMAVLGDQKNGTNIEAPLETIKQALAEVMGEYGGGDITINFTGSLSQLARILKPEIDRENRRVGTSLNGGETVWDL